MDAISLGVKTVPCKREPSLQNVIVFWSMPTSSEKDRGERRKVRAMTWIKLRTIERLNFIRMSLSELGCGAMVFGSKGYFLAHFQVEPRILPYSL